ncbi:AAA family ATPase [Sebaldella sp. S0638]|uniref:AAA family ATPase n=1 Tax=Sebaldella sp. S0638 TaxID=2957809 RepID=UPI00209D4A3A|nr:AAA family ATPase [Sebaldella sp. S0638]MCP1225549.1 AAA family ATPase [Sebaldella sp. S0638]
MSQQFEKLTSDLLKARFPLLYINSWEEQRIIDHVNSMAQNKELIKTTRNVFTWSLTDGLVPEQSNTDSFDKQPLSDTTAPYSFLEFIEQYEEAAIFIAKDFHVFFGQEGRYSPDSKIIRKLRDLAPKLRTGKKPKNIIFVSPVLVLPVELQKDVTIIDFNLPTVKEIKEVLIDLMEANSQNPKIEINLSEDEVMRMATAAQGLTLNEAENAFSRALVKDGKMNINDLKIITEEKQQIIKKNSVLELVNNNFGLSEVGGLGNLKKWLAKREKIWLSSGNFPYPKGVLIAGIPGCGKSLIAKAISASWKSTLLKLDIERTFNGLTGSSEENMREVIKTAEAVSPCILWIDEIEKGIPAVENLNDSSPSSRVFGNFLSWLQEKESPVFIVATANNISHLPPELMRKGRLDEIFFVDLPVSSERKEIFSIHIKKKIGTDLLDFEMNDGTLTKLSDITEGFTGSEIEQVVIETLYNAYSENKKVQISDFIKIIEFTVPLSVTQPEIIRNLRNWADTRAVNTTPKSELSGYTDNTKTESSNGEYNVIVSRGGRMLDF